MSHDEQRRQQEPVANAMAGTSSAPDRPALTSQCEEDSAVEVAVSFRFSPSPKWLLKPQSLNPWSPKPLGPWQQKSCEDFLYTKTLPNRKDGSASNWRTRHLFLRVPLSLVLPRIIFVLWYIHLQGIMQNPMYVCRVLLVDVRDRYRLSWHSLWLGRRFFFFLCGFGA